MIAFNELASITEGLKNKNSLWACHFTPEQKQNKFSACMIDIPFASD